MNKTTNARELLTVFLNESRESDVQDFVIQRNAELALNILPYVKQTYVDGQQKRWTSEKD